MKCPRGTYLPPGASLSCETCPAGSYSSLGATACSACAAGKFSGWEVKVERLRYALSWEASRDWAAARGGRLLTLAEAQAYIANRPLYGSEAWAAIEYPNATDYSDTCISVWNWASYIDEPGAGVYDDRSCPPPFSALDADQDGCIRSAEIDPLFKYELSSEMYGSCSGCLCDAGTYFNHSKWCLACSNSGESRNLFSKMSRSGLLQGHAGREGKNWVLIGEKPGYAAGSSLEQMCSEWPSYEGSCVTPSGADMHREDVSEVSNRSACQESCRQNSECKAFEWHADAVSPCKVIVPDPGNPWHVRTVAGMPASGALEQPAQFTTPTALEMTQDGENLVLSDLDNHMIRMVGRYSGRVTTLAGATTQGSIDGEGTNANFGSPWGIAVAPDETVIVVDHGNHMIRKLNTVTGQVSALAGSPTHGSADGVGSNARFKMPMGVTISPDGAYVYVADCGNNKVRRVDVSSGEVTTVAGSGNAGNTDGSILGQPGTSACSDPTSSAISPECEYSGCNDNDCGTNSLAAGCGVDTPGHWQARCKDWGHGQGAQCYWPDGYQWNQCPARPPAPTFDCPAGISITGDGTSLLVAERDNHDLRLISLELGSVVTVAGSTTAGSDNDASARFRSPLGVAASDQAGSGSPALLADYGNHRIQWVDSSTGASKTLAGSTKASLNDLPGTQAGFRNPSAAVMSPDGQAVYVTDSYNHKVREITPNPSPAGGDPRGRYPAADCNVKPTIEPAACLGSFNAFEPASARMSLLWLTDSFQGASSVSSSLSADPDTAATQCVVSAGSGSVPRLVYQPHGKLVDKYTRKDCIARADFSWIAPRATTPLTCSAAAVARRDPGCSSFFVWHELEGGCGCWSGDITTYCEVETDSALELSFNPEVSQNQVRLFALEHRGDVPGIEVRLEYTGPVSWLQSKEWAAQRGGRYACSSHLCSPTSLHLNPSPAPSLLPPSSSLSLCGPQTVSHKVVRNEVKLTKHEYEWQALEQARSGGLPHCAWCAPRALAQQVPQLLGRCFQRGKPRQACLGQGLGHGLDWHGSGVGW